MSDSPTSLAALGLALSEVASLLADAEVLHALTSHLTAREVLVFARLFKAAGKDDAHRCVVEGIIHGDEEVRAVATPEVTGPGSVRIEYFNHFADSSIEDGPFHVREFSTGGLRNALRELGLEVDTDTIELATIALPGRIVLDSARRD